MTQVLRRSSEGTLHHQLYVTLSEMISSGTVGPGGRLPTEAELVATYGVSRTTARRALDDLGREGVVERFPGRGTFVLRQRVHAAIPHLHSITEEIEGLGFRAGIVPVSVEPGTADATVAAQLDLAVGDAILRVTRIRTADDRPVFVGTSTLPITRFPGLADADFASTGLYPLFERVTGLAIARATQWLSAVPAARDVAARLDLRAGAPVLQLERIVYLDGDLPVESVTGFFHGEIYKHYSESSRNGL